MLLGFLQHEGCYQEEGAYNRKEGEKRLMLWVFNYIGAANMSPTYEENDQEIDH